jgi:hypothetical protein
MHRSEGYDRVRCLQCGAEISIAKDRAYAVSEEAALCMKCALERGGQYDEPHDDWTTPPHLDGLPVEEARRGRIWR